MADASVRKKGSFVNLGKKAEKQAVKLEKKLKKAIAAAKKKNNPKKLRQAQMKQEKGTPATPACLHHYPCSSSSIHDHPIPSNAHTQVLYLQRN